MLLALNVIKETILGFEKSEERMKEAGQCEIAQSGMKNVFCVYSNATV